MCSIYLECNCYSVKDSEMKINHLKKKMLWFRSFLSALFIYAKQVHLMNQ